LPDLQRQGRGVAGSGCKATGPKYLPSGRSAEVGDVAKKPESARRHGQASSEARERLMQLEGDLRTHKLYYAADAIKRFLDGTSKSLDEAFGLVAARRRGRPTAQRVKHLEIARKLLAFRMSDKAKKAGAIGKFEQDLADRHHLSDARKVRGIYEKYWAEVTGEELLRRLTSADADDKAQRLESAELRFRDILKDIDPAIK